MKTRRHDMPFGSTPLSGGGVRFALWAPAASQVELVLEGRGEPLPMAVGENGWFRLETADAAIGSLYRFLIDGETTVPDPASRSQPRDVHGPSEVVEPAAFQWQDGDWRGRPWEEAVLYELNVGTFSPEGDFGGVEAKLDYLAGLGVTALQLMPVAAFPGTRTWGYDGVLPPSSAPLSSPPACASKPMLSSECANRL